MNPIFPIYRLEYRPNVRAVQKSIPFLLTYHSTFIALVRLIIVTLCITHQRDFLWPESRPHLAKNFHMGSYVASPEYAKLPKLTSPDTRGHHTNCITWKIYATVYVLIAQR